MDSHRVAYVRTDIDVSTNTNCYSDAEVGPRSREGQAASPGVCSLGTVGHADRYSHGHVDVGLESHPDSDRPGVTDGHIEDRPNYGRSVLAEYSASDGGVVDVDVDTNHGSIDRPFPDRR